MPSRQYADFDVLMRQVGDAYEGRVVDSPVGETAEVRFAIPFDDLALERFLLRIGHARRRVRGADAQRLAEIRDFGGTLFDALFKDQIGTCLRRSIDRAEGEGKGLRIRLRLPSNRLSDVPWEFLYDRSTGRFLCLSESTPVVRYMELSDSTPRIQVDGPLKMLVVISSPGDYPSLDVEHEWANLEAAVSGLVASGRLEVERLARPTLDMLQRRLRQEDYHVLHYIGHGGVDGESGDGVLVLEDDTGMSRLESGRDLSTLLYDERTMQLAVLNSCEGARAEGTDPFAGTAQALVRQGVVAVLAMQFEITDESAIVFARNFYEALADGLPVDAATNAARKAVFAASKTEWGTPVLYMRAPDGELFRGVTPRPAAEPRSPGEERDAVLPRPRTETGEPTDPGKVVVVPVVGTDEVGAVGDAVRDVVGGTGAEAAAAPVEEVAAAAAGGPAAISAPAVGATVPEVVTSPDALAAAGGSATGTSAAAPPDPTAPVGFLGASASAAPSSTPTDSLAPVGPPPTRPDWSARPTSPPPKRRLPAWVLLVIGVVATVLVLGAIGAVLQLGDDADGNAGDVQETADPFDEGAVDEDAVDEPVDDPVLGDDQVTTVEDACVRRLDGFSGFVAAVTDPAGVEDPEVFQSALDDAVAAQEAFLGAVDRLGAGAVVQFAREDEQEAFDQLAAAAIGNRSGDLTTAAEQTIFASNALGAAQEEWRAIGVDCTLG